MDNQPLMEERRIAQLPCRIDERRLRVFVYEAVLDDQETETAADYRASLTPENCQRASGGKKLR